MKDTDTDRLSNLREIEKRSILADVTKFVVIALIILWRLLGLVRIHVRVHFSCERGRDRAHHGPGIINGFVGVSLCIFLEGTLVYWFFGRLDCFVSSFDGCIGNISKYVKRFIHVASFLDFLSHLSCHCLGFLHQAHTSFFQLRRYLVKVHTTKWIRPQYARKRTSTLIIILWISIHLLDIVSCSSAWIVFEFLPSIRVARHLVIKR